MREVYDGYFVIRVSDESNTDNLPIYSPVFHIVSHGPYVSADPADAAQNLVVFNYIGMPDGGGEDPSTKNNVAKVGTEELPKKLDGTASTALFN